MAEAKRIQLSRAAGWRMPSNTVKVDRSTMWGNPYCVGEPINMKMARRWGWNISHAGRKLVCEDASEAVHCFGHAVHWDEAIHDYVRDQLKGRDLACWCALDAPCHADWLLAIANDDPEQIRALHDAIDKQIMDGAAAVMATEKEAAT